MKPLSPLFFIGMLLCLKSYGQTSNHNCISLDGIDDFIDIGTPILSSSDSYEPFTIEFWVKTSTSEHETIFSQYTKQSPNRTEIKINETSNKLSFWKYNTGVTLVSESIINDGEWHHVAIVKNESRALFLYVDCTLEDTGFDPYPYTDTNFTIGRIFNNGGNRFFEGQVNNFRIWSKVRSMEVISNNAFTTYGGGNIPYLEVSYDFNQGIAGGNNFTEDLAYDSSGNQYDGDLYNFSLTGSTSNWVEFSGAEACQNFITIDSLIYSCTDTLFAFDQIFTEAGLYEVYQEGSQGMDTLFIVDLQFSDPNQFSISPSNSVIHSDETIDCYLADALGNPYDAATSIQWSPAEWFSCDTCVQTTFEGLDTIEYQVDFVDAYGCSNSLSGTYITLPYNDCLLEKVVVPNAFRPSSQIQENRTFGPIYSQSTQQLEFMRIYNRWGALVFETDLPDQEKGIWDGNIEGSISGGSVPAPMDLYIYEISVFCPLENEYKTFKGQLTLIR